MKKALFNTLFLIPFLITSHFSLSQTETFETETNGATSFTTNGFSFTTTGDMMVEYFANLGCNSSDFWFGSGFGDGGSSGSFGSLKATNSGQSFVVSSSTSWCAWTSNNDGTNKATGSVQFTGKLAAGGTINETFSIDPPSDFDFDAITFSSATWDNNPITELSMTIVSGVNYLSLDDLVFASLLLPVELISFDGKAYGSSILLSWTTAREENNAGFAVETSTDNQNWKKIGFVEGNGTSQKETTYDFVHQPRETTLHYYRLRQIDLDGETTLSETISVHQETDMPLSIFPNPSSGIIHLIGSSQELRSVRIYDQQGKLIRSQDINNHQLDLTEMPNGLYSISIWTSQGYVIRRVVKRSEG
ncbi:MAG: T9SS type A sorting domain-containing protein [Bacteroidota bacterium]